MNSILVTGGAGYIGSHIVKNLLKENFQVIVVDDLSTGFIEPIEVLKQKFANLKFVKCDLDNKEAVKEIFLKTKIDAVLHLAAKIEVTEANLNPELYHQANYLNSINLVECMLRANVNKLVFSSTAAVYGNPVYTPIDELHPTSPTNPYGQSKLDFEKYLSKIKNLDFIIFRYFNVGGSDVDGLIGRSHVKSSDLIENALKVVLKQKNIFQIFGNDYDTPDGTAIRDFIHVEDVSSAHILALKNLHKLSGEIFNLGSEKGYSIKEIVDKVSIVSGQKITVEIKDRRPGDISVSLASSKKAKGMLGWEARSSLETIIKTDWEWRRKNPFGYSKNSQEEI